MRSKPPGLHEYLDILDRFLAHCQRHLQPDDWEIVQRRLRATPPGQSVHGAWQAADYVAYYWRRLSRHEQRAFLREQRHARTHQHEEATRC